MTTGSIRTVVRGIGMATLLAGMVACGGSPPETTAPLSPEQQLRADLEQALGSSNREMKRISVFTITDETIQIGWSINDNLTANLVKAGAREDVVDILRVVSESPAVRPTVEVVGVFPLVDQFGNSEDETVVVARYARETLQKINWDRFLRDNVYTVADAVVLDPRSR